jgi:hypothetical protein
MLREPNEKERQEVPPEALVRLIHAERGHLSTRQRALGAQALIARARRGRHGIRLSAGSWAAAALVFGVLAFGAVSVVRARFTNGALTYAIDGGHVAKGGVIEGDSTSPPTVHFSDGTEVLLTSESKAALRSVDGHGARVSLVEGSAHVDVVHKPGASWLFDAGPFLVAVTGTAFTLQWTPLDQVLDLKMDRGTVEVSGPLSDGAISLRSGQHLVVRVPQRETVIRDGEDTPESKRPDLGGQPPPAESGPSTANQGSREPGNVSSSPSRPNQGTGDRGWASAVAKGDYETVVLQAERRGLGASLSEASSAELAALADAARYGRHDDVARRALLAQRRRFPGSSAARDASFLLGRLEETRRDVSGAVEWYDRYLNDSPLGTYVSEALGRKMTLIQQIYGDERARPVAEEYLNRFSQGTYAARARGLAGAR